VDQEHIVGNLTEADELRQLRKQADRRTAEFIPALFHEMFGDPAKNSKRWPTVPLEDVIESTQLGLVRGAKEMNDEFPYAYVRMDAIVGDGSIKFSPIKRVNASKEEVKQFSLKPGDFLFNTRNSRELVGKTGLFDASGVYIFNNNIMRIRFNERVEPRYMNALFQTDHVREQLEWRKSGTTSIVAIYYKALRNVQILVPPVSLQREFAVRVGEVRALEQRQAESRRRLDALFASLLDRAFKGEL
jgi:type I restriction enzyme S subunit